MKKKKRKNSKQFNRQFKKKFFTPMSVLVIICTLIIISIGGIGNQINEKKAAKYQKTIDELKTDIKNLEQTNKSLEKEKNNLNTDESKERIARERLGMIKEGEISLQQAKDDEEAGSTTAAEDSDSTENTSATDNTGNTDNTEEAKGSSGTTASSGTATTQASSEN